MTGQSNCPACSVTTPIRPGGTNTMSGESNIWLGRCHCGAVRFEATLIDGFNSIRRCTCSYCRMRGAVVVMAAMGGVKLLQGGCADKPPLPYRNGAALLLFSLRNIHASSTSIRSEPVWRERRLSGWGKPIRFCRCACCGRRQSSERPWRTSSSRRYSPVRPI
jgi:hypothetical protein